MTGSAARTTEAWVLHAGTGDARAPSRGQLRLESFPLPPMGPQDVLVEPIYGCWEANMDHAIARRPIDVCRERGESPVVLGNSGVVRVLEVGAEVTHARPGDVCLLFGIAAPDPWGYMTQALAYDAPHTMGMLARRSVVHQRNVIPLPPRSRYSLQQWAAFSLRYVTAWANWRVAFGCWKVQMLEDEVGDAHVWGWGGGSTLGELQLARQHGFNVAMIASTDRRLALIASLGIEPIDRRAFGDLSFDQALFDADGAYRARYRAAETAFLNVVKERTKGRGVDIFVDYIGSPVTRATLRSLARQGVMTTAGWKHGMKTHSVRAIECLQRHIHVHTHGGKYSEARAAMFAAEATGWLPPLDESSSVYPWTEVPTLAEDYAAQRVTDYFPIYQINEQ